MRRLPPVRVLRVLGVALCRAAAENASYHQLVLGWLAQKYTLRYSGGMVPDVHHMLAKVGEAGTSFDPSARHSCMGVESCYPRGAVGGTPHL